MKSTWSQGVTLSLVHCVTLRNAIELRQASKLTPHSVVIVEGPYCTVKVTQQTLTEFKTKTSCGM